MKNKLKIFFVIVLVGISVWVFGMGLRSAFFYVPSSEAQTVKSAKARVKIPISYPEQLRLPSIQVTARVQAVGITKNANMATPNNFTDVGWYKYGVLPGKKGSAIIAGHVNNGVALPAVFANLHNLNLGDDVYVDTVGGKQIHFKVVGMQTYDFNAPTGAIFNQNNGKFLKLITCDGVWVEKIKTHDKRLVVTAEEV